MVGSHLFARMIELGWAQGHRNKCKAWPDQWSWPPEDLPRSSIQWLGDIRMEALRQGLACVVVLRSFATAHGCIEHSTSWVARRLTFGTPMVICSWGSQGTQHKRSSLSSGKLVDTTWISQKFYGPSRICFSLLQFTAALACWGLEPQCQRNWLQTVYENVQKETKLNSNVEKLLSQVEAPESNSQGKLWSVSLTPPNKKCRLPTWWWETSTIYRPVVRTKTTRSQTGI